MFLVINAISVALVVDVVLTLVVILDRKSKKMALIGSFEAYSL